MGASKSKPTVDFQQIVDLIPQTITVLDARGTIIYANQAVLDYAGLTVADVTKPDFRDRVFHPEDVERLREERKQALLHGNPFENEQRARGKDGKYRWFLIRYKPLLDETGQPLRWYASGTDIDDLKRAEAKLRYDERELRQLVDSLPQHVRVALEAAQVFGESKPGRRMRSSDSLAPTSVNNAGILSCHSEC